MFIKVRVSAGAKEERIERAEPDLFYIAVREPAERNLANRRVQELLGAHFGVPAGAVRLVSGHHSPGKIFRLPDAE